LDILTNEQILFSIAASFAVCMLCQWLAWIVKLPAIIFLLLAGIISGPVFHVLSPETLMGHLFSPFISLSVAIILFEGSITLKFREIMGLTIVVRNMLSLGLAVTWGITSFVAHWALGISWEIVLLFGAITVVTGPTVIAPLLRTVRPSSAISNILRWEGIVIDSIGAILAVLVYEFIVSGGGSQGIEHTLIAFAQLLGIGGLIGIVGGYSFGMVLRNHWLPEFLQNPATLGLVFVCFVFANQLQMESGLVAVTVLGVWLGNMPGVDLEEILKFKESLSVLLISLLFLMLAARLDVSAITEISWAALCVFVAVQFIARPANVLLSTLGSQLNFRERALLAWIAPRGIVAAAISSLFALKLSDAGQSDARYLVPLTFTVIIGTVLLQSTTARLFARWLKVAEPEPRGFLLVGANLVARKIARALVDTGVRVLLVDTGWDRISKARNEGLETCHGNPLSEQADRHMNLAGIGRMLALSPYEGENVASILHYRQELGRSNIYVVQTRNHEKAGDAMKLPVSRQGKILFGSGVTYRMLARALAEQGEIRTTKLTEQFRFDQFRQLHGNKAMVLFMVDGKGRVHVNGANGTLKPEPGCSLISLFLPEEMVAEMAETILKR
jgi:NhaP-type Na+/H+ or K+/H+ antiporter